MRGFYVLMLEVWQLVLVPQVENRQSGSVNVCVVRVPSNRKPLYSGNSSADVCVF